MCLVIFSVICAFGKAATSSVLINWLHTGEDFYQLAHIEILGASPVFYQGIHLLWICLCSFPVRQICFFFFQELLLSFSIQCLSVPLQVLWHCNKPLSYLLLSADPRHPKYVDSISALNQARQKPVSQATLKNQDIGHTFHSSLSLLREKS